MRRALPLLVATAAACQASPSGPCPGVPVATLQLVGTRQLVGCDAGAPASGFDATWPPELRFGATVSFGSQGDGAALCLDRRGADPLVGAHQGDQVSVALDTSGATLEACAPGCAATVTQTVAGTLQRDAATGAVNGFTGTLTDRASAAAGASCGPCTLPCGATYLLAPAPAAP
ncbi:MAG TPA: hypothetical protein VFP50_11535 [Anaeromyxobacteraceae bacterium]|nr:hypothetical protein [Anaeromyxobacteraceae bacterium]